MKKVLFSLVAMLLLSLSGIAQTTYTKITSTSGLEIGAYYLIVAHHDDLGVLGMGQQRNANNRLAVVVAENGDEITVTPGTDPNSTTDVFQFLLGGGTNAWTFFDEVREGYLYASSSTNNQLQTQTTLDANGQWSIVFNEDGTAEVVAQGENTRNCMRFNPNTSGSPLFSCYASTTSINTRVSFYKAGGAVPPAPEPTNYPTSFRVTHVDGVDVTLEWNDSEGGQLPGKYLVLASTGNITVPVDGVPVPDSDHAQNVNYDNETWTFTGLQGGTTYHFAIFPYTNSGVNIDYKTDGEYPVAEATTEDIVCLLDENFEEDDFDDFLPYDRLGDQSWRIASYGGNSYAFMNGYASGSAHENEDWLISNVLSGMYRSITLQFKTAKNYTGEDLSLMISTNYDGVSVPNNFVWTDITNLFDWSSGGYLWVESGAVDIANYTGESFYIAYVYKSTDAAAAAWEVDDVKIIASEPLSVTEMPNTQLVVSPNPAHEQVSFMLDDNAQVSIFDVMGRMVNTMALEAGQAQLSISELVDGVYFVNVRYANGTTAVSKFVKF